MLKDLLQAKTVVFALFIAICMVPGQMCAQDTSGTIRQFRKTVFKLQQEMLELKDEFDRQKKELLSQKQSLTIQMDQLMVENKKLKKQVLELDSLLFQLEDRLESSSIIKLGKQVENLRNFNQALILDSIDHTEQAEKLLLDIVNQPGTTLPKDLLILLLAQQKRRSKAYEDSLSYYSTLLAEFFGSPYFSQGIYEMSEVLAEMDRVDQQLTLLSQLAAFSTTDKYSLMAASKLRELGAEPLEVEEEYEEETVQEIDATADTMVQKESADSIEESGDATTDALEHVKIEKTTVEESGDATTDALENVKIEKITAEESGDTTTDIIKEGKTDDEPLFENTKKISGSGAIEQNKLRSDATSDSSTTPLFPSSDSSSLQVESQNEESLVKPIPGEEQETQAIDGQEEQVSGFKEVIEPTAETVDPALIDKPVKTTTGTEEKSSVE